MAAGKQSPKLNKAGSGSADRQHSIFRDVMTIVASLSLRYSTTYLIGSTPLPSHSFCAEYANCTMACPEIGVPVVSSEVLDSHSRSDIAKEETEKRHNDSRSSIAQEHNSNDPHGDVVWHYLEFETELPTPNLRQSNGTASERTPPECPDLKKYTSPFLWSNPRKKVMVLLSCLVTIIAAYNAGAYSPGVQQMSEEWNVGRVAVLVGITTFTIGFGIAPMFLAPFSELNGRRPVFVASGVVSKQCLSLEMCLIR